MIKLHVHIYSCLQGIQVLVSENHVTILIRNPLVYINSCLTLHIMTAVMIEMAATVAYLLFSLYCMFINFIRALLGRNSQSLHLADKKTILRVEYS